VLRSRLYELSGLVCADWPANHPKLMRLLAETERLPREELERDVFLLLQKLLEHAQAQVPYYRDRLGAVVRVPLGELTREHYRELVPILTRAELREQSDKLRAKVVSPAHRGNGRISTTSGSTGRPIATEGTLAASALSAAQQERFHAWHRRDLDATTAFITSPHVPKGGARRAGWSISGSGAAIELSLLAPLSEQLDWLVRERPRYLVCYPSNLRALVRESMARGVRPEGLADVTVSSEPIGPELRELCASAWGVPLVGTYSASEVGGIALERPGDEHYTIQAEFVLVEVLREDGAPCAPGEVGRVVVTALHQALRPLIRYEIGDYARAEAEPAVGLPRLGRVLGRERNMVTLPGGGEVWPFFELAELAALRALKQWQLVQRSESEIEVRIVSDRALTALEERTLTEVVHRCLPARFALALRYVPLIPRSPSGKYEEFVNATVPGFADPLSEAPARG
jgi:phenylacetate-CoA ligase